MGTSKKQNLHSTRSSAAEYLTFVAATGDRQDRLFLSDYDRYLIDLEARAGGKKGDSGE